LNNYKKRANFPAFFTRKTIKETRAMNEIKKLEELGACREGLKWLKNQADFSSAWKTCKRGDWMLWLLGKRLNLSNESQLRQLTLAKALCAKLVLHLMKDERSKKAVQVAEDFGNGKATKEELDAAAFAAAASAAAFAADADADAAFAASAAAASAAADADAFAAFATAAAASAAAFAAAASATDAAADAFAADADVVAACISNNSPKLEILAKCADIIRTVFPDALIL
jgi:hypothetical protein